MNLQSLSSEIFFDIFDFLDDIHILHGFYNLNYRFNDLLLTYFRVSPKLNLQFITKFDFDIICKYFLPLITDKIQSLRLSNDDNTPQQIDLFLFYGLTLYKFPHLKSLSLYNMHSEQIINRMIIEWQYPINITHLNITNCQVLNDWIIVDSLINNIWSLPKLTHCQLDITVIDDNYSITPTIISTTLESLSIKNMHCNFEELINLFEHTPRLQYLDIKIKQESTDYPYLSFPVPLMTTLKLTYEGQFNALKNLLQNVPNLRNWTMRIKNNCIKGHEWAEIISNHLPDLTVFYLLMQFDFQYEFLNLSELVSTYTSNFWLNEHKWYIQGHCYYHKPDQTIYLYTLPYTFNNYYIPFNNAYSRFESYFSNFSDQIFYDHVHNLSCISFPLYQFRNRFPQIQHLVSELPFNNNFWTFIPTFDQLRILEISLSYTEAYNKDALFQLQTLLERAPKLYSLTFTSSIDLLLPLLECTSESIVKLDFQSCGEYFDHSDCATVFLSSLGKQCKILSIEVNDRMNILQLVKEIPELQTLNVEYPPDKYNTDSSLSGNDQLIKWLQHQLPSTCMITRDSTQSNRIQIWIR